MGRVTFTYTTTLKVPLPEVWSFFKSATNLTKLTAFPKVTILSNPETSVGNEIEMNVSFFFFSTRWVSHIEKVEVPHRFVDRGVTLPFPFYKWEHEHCFVEKKGETVIIDTVNCHSLLPTFLVRIMLKQMFKSRERNLRLFFHP